MIRKYIKFSNTLNNRDQSTTLFLTFVLVIIFLVFAIRPGVLAIAKLTAQKQSLKELDQKLTEKISTLSQAELISSRYAENLVLLEYTIPADSNEQKLLRDLEYVTILSQVNLTAITMSYETENKEPAEINMQIGIKGDFKNTVKFLFNVNNMLRIIKVKSVAISPEERTGLLEVSINAKA